MPNKLAIAPTNLREPGLGKRVGPTEGQPFDDVAVAIRHLKLQHFYVQRGRLKHATFKANVRSERGRTDRSPGLAHHVHHKISAGINIAPSCKREYMRCFRYFALLAMPSCVLEFSAMQNSWGS